MNAIDELIEQATQEEVDRQQAKKIFEAMQKEEKFQKLQNIARYISTILGPGWEELKPFMVETYQDNRYVNYKLSDAKAECLEMSPFKVWSNGSSVHFENERIGDQIIHDQKEFARFLMIFRSHFPAWNEARKKRIRIEELNKVYEYDLIAWYKECNRILEANRMVIEAAQKDIPSFEIYDLEYVVIIGDLIRKEHAWVLDPSGGRDSNGEVFYLEIERFGNIHPKKYFHPISVNIEAVIIEPGQKSGYCRKRYLVGGTIYYGPNLHIEDYLPLVIDTPGRPAPPDGLPDWDRINIETEIESMDVSQL